MWRLREIERYEYALAAARARTRTRDRRRDGAVGATAERGDDLRSQLSRRYSEKSDAGSRAAPRRCAWRDPPRAAARLAGREPASATCGSLLGVRLGIAASTSTIRSARIGTSSPRSFLAVVDERRSAKREEHDRGDAGALGTVRETARTVVIESGSRARVPGSSAPTLDNGRESAPRPKAVRRNGS